VVVDWGIFQNVVALSEGRLRAVEVWDPLNAKKPVRGNVLEQLDDPSARYVLHVPEATSFPRARSRFFAVVRREGRRARLEHTVPTRLGQPLFEVYRLT
jgi:hypothetical protein